MIFNKYKENEDYRSRKHHVNIHFFDECKGESKAYILGLMYSDGYVYENTYLVGITSTDIELLELINTEMESTYPIRLRKRKSITHKESYELLINNKTLYYAIVCRGCIKRKTHKIKFPLFLEKEDYNHFIRGIFDGDGCVRVDKKGNIRFDIIGTYNLLEKISEILYHDAMLPLVKIQNHSSVFRIQYGGNHNGLKFKKYLYNNVRLYLKRKKKIFVQSRLRYKKRSYENVGR